ncbi:MAG: GNAT family N-acetyltransferase, partial [Desulfobacterales bacterium]|nr:GNAT family N-acetyltransferase [Desulfobacterales bacterium]
YRRITYVIALKFGRTLVYFHTARLPVYNKLSTGNITIHLMGLWMQENGFNNIDFGMGDEGYKYYFANHNRTIWKVRGARSLFSPTAFLGAAESYLREKVCLMRLWTAVKNSYKSVTSVLRR